MNYRHREETLANLSRALPDLAPSQVLAFHRAIHRVGTTLHRLAEAGCNGDWPADNGERKVTECAKCQGLWVKSSFRGGICPDCYAEDHAKKLCATVGLTANIQGDPRGYVLRVVLPNGSEIGIA